MNGLQENQKLEYAPNVNHHIGIGQKRCSICKKFKLLTEFYKSKNSSKGIHSYCRICSQKRAKTYYTQNREDILTQCHKYYKDNKEKRTKAHRIYHKKNREKLLKSQREYREKNKYEINKKIQDKRENNPKFKLNQSISIAIYKSLIRDKNGYHWESLVDYTLNDFKKHLEKLFQSGMTWSNYGEWHIDHKIPISAFNFNKAEDIDFKKCWALSNLQPMWAADNISKGAKLTKPFQPSLAF